MRSIETNKVAHHQLDEKIKCLVEGEKDAQGVLPKQEELLQSAESILASDNDEISEPQEEAAPHPGGETTTISQTHIVSHCYDDHRGCVEASSRGHSLTPLSHCFRKCRI